MRKYDKEFKEEAVKLPDEIGVKQAAASGRQRPGRISARFWVFTFCTVLDFSNQRTA
ncbi:hypothetical protein OBV_29060 [Oscillibacter valericigenes Sjm18-20]|nr:hypothetical protein OBV_29060 [Oscillibacter valericigenes Sjm18-20]